MSAMADLVLDIYGYDDLVWFADHTDIDTDKLDEVFWEVVMSDTNPDRANWVLWNWIDCEGERSISQLYDDFTEFFGSDSGVTWRDKIDSKILCSNSI